MSKEFSRIEKGVNTVVGKPVSWLLYGIWLVGCWSIAKGSQLWSKCRQRTIARNVG